MFSLQQNLSMKFRSLCSDFNGKSIRKVFYRITKKQSYN